MYAIRSYYGGALFDSLTVFDNVAFPLQEKTDMGEGEIRERVLSRLAQVGLEEAQGKFPDELSGGVITSYSIHYTKLYEATYLIPPIIERLAGMTEDPRPGERE